MKINNKRQKIVETKKSSDRAIIFDTGTLISLSMNGLLPELTSLKGTFSGKFIITKEVKKEVIDRPLEIKRFELEALKIKQLLEEGILNLPDSYGISDEAVSAETGKVLDIANNTFYEKSRAIQIIQTGEASCLALSKILSSKGIRNVISVDERTTRLLSERPKNLHEILEKKLHTKINVKQENLAFFKEFKFIRSAELMYVAYKKGLVHLGKDISVLDALLYAVKFKGAAISFEEIEEMKRISVKK